MIGAFIRTRAARAVLTRVSGHAAGLTLLNKLAFPRGVYKNPANARQICQKLGKRDHLDGLLVENNFASSVARRISDYPVLWWLSQIAATGPLRVFEFGGGIGQAYVQYSRALPTGAIARWTVMDLPSVVEKAKQPGVPGGPQVEFTTELSSCRGHNVFLAAGALHYWEQSMQHLAHELGGFPEHTIVNRSPLRAFGDPYTTVQTSGHWAVPCLVRTREQLVSEFSSLGLTVVDEWDVPEKTVSHLLFPGFVAAYRGLYLRRVTP